MFWSILVADSFTLWFSAGIKNAESAEWRESLCFYALICSSDTFNSFVLTLLAVILILSNLGWVYGIELGSFKTKEEFDIFLGDPSSLVFALIPSI